MLSLSLQEGYVTFGVNFSFSKVEGEIPELIGVENFFA
jgi:hypothetical protein